MEIKNELFENSVKISEQIIIVNTISLWDDYGFQYGYDYKAVRKEIKNLYLSQGWDNLPDNEKKICCHFFVNTQAERDNIYSFNEQVEQGKKFYEQTVKAREKRLDLAITEVYNRFNWQDINSIIDMTVELNQLYLKYGREGTLEGNPVGLFDYVRATPGTIYELNGLAVSGFIPAYGNLSDAVNVIMTILQTGKK